VLTDCGEVRGLAALLGKPGVLVRDGSRRDSDGEGARWIAGTEREITEGVGALLDAGLAHAPAAAGAPAKDRFDGDATVFEAIANLPLRAASLAA
jgi:hypothetical protein